MSSISRLLQIMARLRHPQRGCPWDLEQTFATIAPYTIEEAYEVADAIERGDSPSLRDELGDLLFQVVFHAQMASEQGSFAFDDVVASICDKMERRHPHVFGPHVSSPHVSSPHVSSPHVSSPHVSSNGRIDSAAAQSVAWEEQKRQERERAGASVLADVPLALPALTRANKLGKRAAQVGFEWADVAGALDKLDEELGELRAGLGEQESQARILDELGDVLFCVVNVCRYLQVDPETALRGANAKFERRFGYVERRLREQGRSTGEATLEEMDALWDEGKGKEADSG